MKRIFISSLFILSSVLAQPVIAQDRYSNLDKQDQIAYSRLKSAIAEVNSELSHLNLEESSVFIDSYSAEETGNINEALARIELRYIRGKRAVAKLKLEEIEDEASAAGFYDLVHRKMFIYD